MAKNADDSYESSLAAKKQQHEDAFHKNLREQINIAERLGDFETTIKVNDDELDYVDAAKEGLEDLEYQFNFDENAKRIHVSWDKRSQDD